MTEFIEREHRTSRSCALRFRGSTDWFGAPAVEITSLPNRWITNDPEDLDIVSRHAAEAAAWLRAAQEPDVGDVDVSDTQTGQGVP